jgi:uncharacterized pyridoxal phosphate-containing UPF0001 family protein
MSVDGHERTTTPDAIREGSTMVRVGTAIFGAQKLQ